MERPTERHLDRRIGRYYSDSKDRAPRKSNLLSAALVNHFYMNLKRLARSLRDSKPVLFSLIVGLRVIMRFGLLKSERYYRHVPYRGIVTVEVPNGREFHVVARGGQLENSLYWQGVFAHEARSMHTWLELAQSANVVLDIGANSGIYALAAAAAGAREIHAFEPLPRIFAILHENLAANSLLVIHAWPYAISSEGGEADLFDPGGDAPTSASLSSEFSHARFGDALTRIRVPVTSIDAFCTDRAMGQVDLIKLDVEGNEEQALRGMTCTVRRSKPRIIIEVLEEYESRLAAVVWELFGNDYRWSRIDEGGGQENRNVLLTPNF